MQSSSEVRAAAELPDLTYGLYKTVDVSVRVELDRCVGVIAVPDDSSSDTAGVDGVPLDYLTDEIKHLSPSVGIVPGR